ncbi:F-box/LRR-repeat protein At3g26922-like isoform X1 [Carex rostrata]
MKRVALPDISSRGNCDFISGLPDPILHHILEFLKTKEAVQTCVLSKSWQHLWTALPSLKFTYDLLQRRILTKSEDDDDDDDDAYEYNYDYILRRKADSRRFVKFVSTLLLRRNPLDLDMFRLSCDKLYGRDVELETDWIHYAVNHNTRILDVTLIGSGPSCIYTCTSLEELYLHGVSLGSSIQIVNLPNLRKLSIYSADLYSNHVKSLLSGCTILEFLRLDTCRLSECIISHECLKHLAILNCSIQKGTQFSISTPKLLSFLYDGKLSSYKTTINMPSLTSSCLMNCDNIKEYLTATITYSYLINLDNIVNIFMEGMATCLRYLANVELLELHFERVGYKVLNPQALLSLELPIFPKLENMTVAFGVLSCFQMVILIIKNSPNLKKLTILQREGCLSSVEMEASTNELASITSTSSTIAASSNKKLEIVEVKYCIYDQMIRQLVDTLMDGTKESKNLKIHLTKYESSKQYLTNERLSFIL